MCFFPDLFFYFSIFYSLKFRGSEIFGGESEIRTHESCYTLHAFQACAFNHSAISPSLEVGKWYHTGGDISRLLRFARNDGPLGARNDGPLGARNDGPLGACGARNDGSLGAPMTGTVHAYNDSTLHAREPHASRS